MTTDNADQPPPLTIPDEAITATYGDPMTESATNNTIRAVLRLGAPVVVAAELRRLVDFLLREEVRTVYACAGVLERRADELAPDGAR